MYQIIIRILFVLLFIPIRLWLLLKRFFSILWHPLTLVIATVYFNVVMLRGRTTFSFSQLLPDDVVLLFLGLVLYGLGVGTHIARRTTKRTGLFTFSISVLLIIGLYWYLTPLNQNNYSSFLTINRILLAVVAVGTAVSMIYGYIVSRRVFSRVIIDVKPIAINWSSFRSVRLMRTHRLVVALLVLQIAVNVFVLLRLSDMESRLGSTLFTACNAEQSIKSRKNSIIRITSDMGEGTGMIIREDGYILTNALVVADDPAPKIIFSDYTFKTSKVIYLDKEKDIAVVKVDGSDYQPMIFIDPKDVALRSALYAVGFPLGTTIRGEATITRFIFTAIRSIKDITTDMLQLEGVGTGGASGSPILTSCGEVAGMFTAGTEGISLAISSKSITNAIAFLSSDPSVWLKPPEYPLEPDKSAEEAVKAYYTFIKMRNFKRAYLMLTSERVASVPLDTWMQGYEKTLDVTLISIQKDSLTPTPIPTPKSDKAGLSTPPSERIAVRIRSLDLEGQDIVVRYFEGPWIVVHDGEFWRLSDSNIKLVKEPGWDWFW